MDGSVELRFVGSARAVGPVGAEFRAFFRAGQWSRQQVDMRVELEKSALEEVARLIDRRGFGLHGVDRARCAAFGTCPRIWT